MENAAHVTEAVQRLKTVFLQVPDLRLTVADASLLSGLDRLACHLVLAALEDARFVTRGRDGLYQRGRNGS